MIFWLTFHENNEIKELRVGGTPTGDFMEIALELYEEITMSPPNVSWIRNAGGLEKIESLPEPVASNVPYTVSIRQARKALHQKGLLQWVENSISYMSEEDKIDWEYTTELHRHYPLVQSIKTLLQLTEEQLDELFTLASTL